MAENLTYQKDAIEKYQKEIRQRIFSQEVRFKRDNGKIFPKWKRTKLGEIFNEETDRAGIQKYDLLSVTQKSGVIKHDSRIKKDNSSNNKSNYKVVHVGDIVYNTMRNVARCFWRVKV